ncbi:hypothetical protein SEEGA711_09132, partial [Salmonella enterica subsp. enterica serovar Gaminara str. ATCC BAA-711]
MIKSNIIFSVFLIMQVPLILYIVLTRDLQMCIFGMVLLRT